MKTELMEYRPTDRRVYNGEPCSDMRREYKHTKALEEMMKELEPTASCTYFPAEGKYLTFTNSNILDNPDLEGPPEILTNNFHVSKQRALIEAIGALQERRGRDG